MAWSRSYNVFADSLLRTKLRAVTASDGPLAIRIADVPRLNVDASSNVRKGKKYVTFDISFTLVWEGFAPSGAVTRVTRGELAVQDLMQDDVAGEFQVRMTTFSSATAFDTTCRDIMAGKGCAAVRGAVRSFASELIAHDDALEASARAAVDTSAKSSAVTGGLPIPVAPPSCEPTPSTGISNVVISNTTQLPEKQESTLATAATSAETGTLMAAAASTPAPTAVAAVELQSPPLVGVADGRPGNASEWNKDAFHWEERPLTAWAKDRLSALLLGVDIDIPGGCVKVVDVKLSGEASASLRRGRRLVFFEFSITATWEGSLLNAESGDIIGTGDGTLVIPDIDQDSGSAYEVLVTPADDGGARDAQLADMFAKHGVAFVRSRLSQFVQELTMREGCVFKPTSAIGLFQQTGSMWKHLQQAVASHDDDSSGTADNTVSVSSDGANTGADALLDATSDLDYTNVVRSEAEVAADASLVEHVPSSILQLTLDDASGSGASLVQTDAPSLDVVLSQEHLALELYSRAEEARWGAPSAGIVRNASLALQLLREAAALRAGRGSASALCALARMHETGWNGNPDLDVYLPLALVVGGLHRQSSGSRVLRRVTRMLKPFIVEGRAALDVVAGVARKAMAASAADGGALTTTTDTPPPRHSRQLQHNTTLVQPDMATAVALYKEAAELGNATAAFTMAVLHSYGLFGVPADERKAVLYHYFASIGGSPAARLALGHRHNIGLGTPKACPASVLYLEDEARAAAAAYSAEGSVIGVVPPPQRTRLDDDVVDDGLESEASKGEGALVSLYLAAADRGDGNAHHILGYFYLLGIRGAMPDAARALEHFHAAAELDESNAAAASALAFMYFHGIGTERDPAIARSLLDVPLAAGNVVAVNLLGVMHATGEGAPRDDAEAFRLLHNAANEGKLPDAQYNVALMLISGTAPGGRDFRSAIAMLQSAAGAGHVPAMYKLGYMTLHGMGVPRDCAAAQRAFAGAVSNGVVRGPLITNALELLVDNNAPAALLEYLRASEIGVEIGAWNAAYLLEHVGVENATSAIDGTGLDGVASQPSIVSSTLPSDGDAGSSGSSASGLWARVTSAVLATWTAPIRAKQYLTASSAHVAVRLYERSAAAGNAWADLRLGYMHHAGRGGLPASSADAAVSFLDACNQHVPDACFALGQMYETGDGVARDDHLAKRYYDMCLENQKLLRLEAAMPVRLAFFRMRIRGAVARAARDYIVPLAQMLGVEQALPPWVAAVAAIAEEAAVASAARAVEVDTVAADNSATQANNGDATSIDDGDAAKDDAASRLVAAIARARTARLQRQQDDSLVAAVWRAVASVVDPIGRHIAPGVARTVHAGVQAVGEAIGFKAAARFSVGDSFLFAASLVVIVGLALHRWRRRRRMEGAAPAVQVVAIGG